MGKGSGTRSGLLWEVERLLSEMNELPQVLLMENVDAVHGTGNLEHFQDWIRFLDGIGYSTYYEDLNAKNYGVAQNRNRCFAVSLLGDYVYHFPQPIPLNKTMKDYLEDEVAEKYYLKSAKAQKLIMDLIMKDDLDVANTEGEIVKFSELSDEERKNLLDMMQDTATIATERNGTERNGTERNGCG